MLLRVGLVLPFVAALLLDDVIANSLTVKLFKHIQQKGFPQSHTLHPQQDCQDLNETGRQASSAVLQEGSCILLCQVHCGHTRLRPDSCISIMDTERDLGRFSDRVSSVRRCSGNPGFGRSEMMEVIGAGPGYETMSMEVNELNGDSDNNREEREFRKRHAYRYALENRMAKRSFNRVITAPYPRWTMENYLR